TTTLAQRFPCAVLDHRLDMALLPPGCPLPGIRLCAADCHHACAARQALLSRRCLPIPHRSRMCANRALDQQTSEGTSWNCSSYRSTRVGFLPARDASTPGSMGGDLPQRSAVVFAHFETENRNRTSGCRRFARRLREHAWLDRTDRHRESRLPGTSTHGSEAGGGSGTELQPSCGDRVP